MAIEPIVTVDQGAGGAIAWLNDLGEINAINMPDGMTEQVKFFQHLKDQGALNATIEKVGTYMPGNSGPAAAKFARHCGHIECMLYCLSFGVEQVTPRKWMQFFGTLPKEKPQRKRAIKEEVQRRLPGLRVTLKTADALGILLWKLESIK